MSKVSGTWVNEYGSQLHLIAEGDFLHGHYLSNTGSVGKYHVVGYVGDRHAQVNHGTCLVLGVLWRSFAPGVPDPSWHWVSGMAGQWHTVADGIPKITLNHNLVATIDWPQLFECGSYIDKMIFKPAPFARVALPPPLQACPIRADPIDGNWNCKMFGIEISLALRNSATGEVSGSLKLAGHSTPIIGYVDCFVDGQTVLEGVTLVSILVSGRCISFSGHLNLESDVLSLLQQCAVGTISNQMYLQTQVQGLYFERY